MVGKPWYSDSIQAYMHAGMNALVLYIAKVGVLGDAGVIQRLFTNHAPVGLSERRPKNGDPESKCLKRQVTSVVGKDDARKADALKMQTGAGLVSCAHMPRESWCWLSH